MMYVFYGFFFFTLYMAVLVVMFISLAIGEYVESFWKKLKILPKAELMYYDTIEILSFYELHFLLPSSISF